MIMEQPLPYASYMCTHGAPFLRSLIWMRNRFGVSNKHRWSIHANIHSNEPDDVMLLMRMIAFANPREKMLYDIRWGQEFDIFDTEEAVRAAVAKNPERYRARPPV